METAPDGQDDRDDPRDRGSNGAEGASLSTDAVFEILSSPRRRTVIEYFVDRSSAVDVPVADLVDVVNRADGSDRNAVEVELRHHHLPMLADYGVVSFDRRNDRIRYRERPPLERCLRAVTDASTRPA